MPAHSAQPTPGAQVNLQLVPPMLQRPPPLAVDPVPLLSLLELPQDAASSAIAATPIADITIRWIRI